MPTYTELDVIDVDTARRNVFMADGRTLSFTSARRAGLDLDYLLDTQERAEAYATVTASRYDSILIRATKLA